MSAISAPKKPESGTQTSSKKADHALSMKKIYIHQIRSRQKCIEGRIHKGPVKNLVVGHTLRFYYMSNASDDVICKITKIEKYASFKEMLDNVSFRDCVPEAKSQADALALYLSIPGFAEKQREFGVSAIYLKVIKA